MVEDLKIAPQDGAETPERGDAASAKRRQVLAGARKVFLSRGFAAASMGEIAKAAGVSKGTLYVYFDSKDALFRALIEEQRRNTAERITRLDPENHDIEAVLAGFAERLMTEMSAPDHVGLVRAVIGAAEDFPDLGRVFFESGPGFGARRLAAWLQAQEEAGALTLDEPEAAAWRFLGSCAQPTLTATLLGQPRPAPEEIARRARSVAAAFFAAHRPR